MFDAAKPLMGPRAVGGQEDSAALHCDPSGPPQLLILPNPWEIVQIPGRMFMFFEEYHIWRTIWTDGRPLPKDPDPTWLDYSVGHWEGDTFIVDTVGFNEGRVSAASAAENGDFQSHVRNIFDVPDKTGEYCLSYFYSGRS